MTETPDTDTEKSQVELIQELLMNVEFIESVSFKSEGPIEQSPNSLTIVPKYGVSELRLRLLGRTVTKLLQAIHPQYEIKGRLTHKLHEKTNDDGDMIGFKPIMHLPRVKIQWFGHRWDRTPEKEIHDGDVAFEIPPNDTIESEREFIEQIAAVEAASFNSHDSQPAVENTDTNTEDTDIIDI